MTHNDLSLDIPDGWSLQHRELVDSTNSLACMWAKRHDIFHKTAFLADQQAAGRGRRGREWISPPGNMYLSLLLQPRTPQQQWPELAFVAAVSVHDALADMLPDARGLGCKWPNDILLQRHKVCGILLETAADDGVVVGIGANVAYVPHLDTHLYAATSLYDHGADCSARRLALAVMQHMGVWYDIWSRQGFSPIAQAWTKRAVGIGQAVCVRNTNEPDLTGILQGICPQTGALHVQKPDGTIIKVLAGDVHLV